MNDYKIGLRKPITTGKILTPHVNTTTGQIGKAEVFDSLLQQAIEDRESINFSKHAKERIETRNIDLTEGDMNKLVRAFELAKQKGVEDSLVIMDNLALIVNVPTKTVVTAINGQHMQQNVFTNIDGAVIV